MINISYQEKLKKQGQAVLEIMEKGVEYRLDTLKDLVKKEIKEVFAVVDAEFNDAILYLFKIKKIVEKKEEKKSYSDFNGAIYCLAKTVSVVKH